MSLPDTCSECDADAMFYQRNGDGDLVPYCSDCLPSPDR